VLKQFLQASAIDVMQIDACRMAGVNENLAYLLIAAKFRYRSARTRAVRHGAGRCEIVQHLSPLTG
jgi:L-fuconate dehydratase